MVACAYGGWASSCRSLGVRLASDDGASVACMQPPSANPSSPKNNHATPDLGTASPPKRYIAPFAARIVQKSWQRGDNAEKRGRGLSIGETLRGIFEWAINARNREVRLTPVNGHRPVNLLRPKIACQKRKSRIIRSLRRRWPGRLPEIPAQVLLLLLD